jgi:hypothetical protein
MHKKMFRLMRVLSVNEIANVGTPSAARSVEPAGSKCQTATDGADQR